MTKFLFLKSVLTLLLVATFSCSKKPDKKVVASPKVEVKTVATKDVIIKPSAPTEIVAEQTPVVKAEQPVKIETPKADKADVPVVVPTPSVVVSKQDVPVPVKVAAKEIPAVEIKNEQSEAKVIKNSIPQLGPNQVFKLKVINVDKLMKAIAVDSTDKTKTQNVIFAGEVYTQAEAALKYKDNVNSAVCMTKGFDKIKANDLLLATDDNRTERIAASGNVMRIYLVYVMNQHNQVIGCDYNNAKFTLNDILSTTLNGIVELTAVDATVEDKKHNRPVLGLDDVLKNKTTVSPLTGKEENLSQATLKIVDADKINAIAQNGYFDEGDYSIVYGKSVQTGAAMEWVSQGKVEMACRVNLFVNDVKNGEVYKLTDMQYYSDKISQTATLYYKYNTDLGNEVVLSCFVRKPVPSNDAKNLPATLKSDLFPNFKDLIEFLDVKLLPIESAIGK